MQVGSQMQAARAASSLSLQLAAAERSDQDDLDFDEATLFDDDQDDADEGDEAGSSAVQTNVSAQVNGQGRGAFPTCSVVPQRAES